MERESGVATVWLGSPEVGRSVLVRSLPRLDKLKFVVIQHLVVVLFIHQIDIGVVRCGFCCYFLLITA